LFDKVDLAEMPVTAKRRSRSFPPMREAGT
jgi:hypothetical protein